MDDLRPIRIFLNVARQRSFAAAARDLGLTPATVTRAVAKLERDLGEQLLLRTTRQVSLTSAGAVIAARYGTLVDDLDAMTAEFRKDSLADAGRLRINAPLSFGLKILPGLVDGFRLAYPHVALKVSLTDRLIDVMEEKSDLAIRISQPPEDKSTIWRKICEIPRHAVAAPSFLDRVGRTASPDDLQRAHCLSYGEGGDGELWSFRKEQVTRSVRASENFVSNSGDLLLNLAQTGAGIAVLPRFMVSDGLAQGTLEEVLSGWTVAPLWLSLFYPPYQHFPPLVATFSDYFEAYLRDQDIGIFA
ncbi:MAG: LysR family transcriptional regulator [Cohaesibacteraceae bacterium]